MLGLIQKLKKVSQLLKPYFLSRGSYQKNRLLFAGFLICNLVSAFAIASMYTYMSTFLGLLALPLLTYEMFFASLIEFMGVLALYGASQATNYFCTHKLIQSLTDSLNQDLSDRWLSRHSFYGLELGQQEQPPDMNKILRDDTSTIIYQSFELLQTCFNTTFGFLIGSYRLWIMSVGVTISLFNRTITMPGLMSLGAVLYALGYNFLSIRLSRQAPPLILEEKEKDGYMQQVIHHIKSNREAIALQNSANNEKHFYTKAYKALINIKTKLLDVKTRLTFFDNVHGYLSLGFGLLLSAPSIIAKKIQATDILEINSYFTSIIHFFSATHLNREIIQEIDTSLYRINNLQQKLQRWENDKKNTIVTFRIDDTLKVQGLTVNTPPPSGLTLIQEANHTFQQGKTTLITGITGSGKSTFFRVVAGIWPYAQGECNLPFEQEEVHIIPQNPCLPYRSTLLEAITYVLKDPKSASKNDVIDLLKALGLENKINQLNETASWSNILSGGERSRIALAGAFLKKPKLLLLDETFGMLDDSTRTKVETLMKKHLPDTTILVVDHHPDSRAAQHTPFYDAKVEITRQKIQAVSHQIEQRDSQEAIPHPLR